MYGQISLASSECGRSLLGMFLSLRSYSELQPAACQRLKAPCTIQAQLGGMLSLLPRFEVKSKLQRKSLWARGGNIEVLQAGRWRGRGMGLMKPGGTRVLRELPAVQPLHPSPFATSPKLQKHLKGTSTGCGKWKKSC